MTISSASAGQYRPDGGPKRRRPGRRESGMALVMVLGVLAATLLMVTHLMLVSEIIAKALGENDIQAEGRFIEQQHVNIF